MKPTTYTSASSICGSPDGTCAGDANIQVPGIVRHDFRYHGLSMYPHGLQRHWFSLSTARGDFARGCGAPHVAGVGQAEEESLTRGWLRGWKPMPKYRARYRPRAGGQDEESAGGG